MQQVFNYRKTNISYYMTVGTAPLVEKFVSCRHYTVPKLNKWGYSLVIFQLHYHCNVMTLLEL